MEPEADPRLTIEPLVRRRLLEVGVAWLLAPVAFALLVGPPLERLRGLYLSTSAACALVVLEGLRGLPGWTACAALMVACALPVGAGADPARVARWLRLAALQAAACLLLGIGALLEGGARRGPCHCPPSAHPPLEDGLVSVLLDVIHSPFALPVLVVGALQLRAWLGLARELQLQPRFRLAHELRVATFLALPPGAVLAVAAISAVHAVDWGPTPLLLAPPALAAAGVALLAAIGVAVLLRTRAAPT